jgi:predicted ribonucleotide reductase-associated flavodoxin
MHILLAYASLSGNTRDVARRVQAQCEAAGHQVTLIHTDVQTLHGVLGDAAHAAGFDLHLLGSWSDNAGRTPAEMKRYIAELVEAAGKRIEVAAFGTGACRARSITALNWPTRAALAASHCSTDACGCSPGERASASSRSCWKSRARPAMSRRSHGSLGWSRAAVA